MQRLEITKGDRFGMLTVIREVAKHGQYRAFRLRCDCGKCCEVRLNHLRRTQDPVRSCGCQQLRGMDRRTHGGTGSVMYKIWCGMKKRCNNSNDRSYPDYGGRGIKVCERWASSFENFLTDMGERPSTEHQLDRIDNERGYEPGNVRWATRQMQVRNRRKISGTISKYRGVDSWKNKKWRARIVIDGKLHHLGMFETEELAARAYDAAAQDYSDFHLNFPIHNGGS